MPQNPNPNKDEWIQAVKALLYDCKWAVDSDQLVSEIEKKLREGGGFDPLNETAVSKLKWRK